MKYFILLLGLMPFIAVSQLTVKAVIWDIKNAPLPYTNVVTVKKTNGTVTNEKGQFELLDVNTEDSLKITNVSYLPLTIPVDKLRPSDTIFLTENISQLDEVKISNQKYSSEAQLGFFNYDNNGEFKLIPGNQISVFIQNTLNRETLVKGVSFRLKNKGKCNISLRLRILNTRTSGPAPFLDILNENIIIKNSELNLKNFIDLTKQRILMPPAGIFVVLELLYPETNGEQSYTSLSASLTVKKKLVWLNFRDRKWDNSHIPRLPNGNYMTPNISVKVAY